LGGLLGRILPRGCDGMSRKKGNDKRGVELVRNNLTRDGRDGFARLGGWISMPWSQVAVPYLDISSLPGLIAKDRNKTIHCLDFLK
jgi:hypothetical protein